MNTKDVVEDFICYALVGVFIIPILIIIVPLIPFYFLGKFTEYLCFKVFG